MPIEDRPASVSAATHGPKHHYFGYYDKWQFDATDRYLLGLECDFVDRPQTGDDAATVGVIDLHDGHAWRPLAQTKSWCWQQGCMLQWLPGATSKIIYNDRHADRYVAVILDVNTGEKRVLPRAVYTVSPDGRWAVSPDFARVGWCRPGYGYYGLKDRNAADPAPADDGVTLMNLQTGESDLIISIAQMAAYRPRPDMAGAVHWFNHLLWNADGSRFIFLHRCRGGGTWRRRLYRRYRGGDAWLTRLFTAARDGSEFCLLNDDDMTSHFIWRGTDRILAWATTKGKGDRYTLFTDRSGEREFVGEDVFTCDGHCSYSPVDPDWIVTDTYPDAERKRTLILYHRPTNRRIDIGRFYAPPEFEGEMRVDLHPRWSRDGRTVCIDSAHEGERQMYLVDVGGVLDGN